MDDLKQPDHRKVVDGYASDGTYMPINELVARWGEDPVRRKALQEARTWLLRLLAAIEEQDDDIKKVLHQKDRYDLYG